jgi:D-xylose transport system permease protein
MAAVGGDQSAVTGPEQDQSLTQRAMRVVNWRIASTAVVLATLSLVFHLTSNHVFFTPRNLSLLVRQASLVAILAAGVSVLMIMAEIDLSIGGAVLLTGAVAAELTVVHGLPTWLGVLAALGAGAVLGAWNGFWVSRFGVPSFVVTLAGLLGFGGLALMWTSAATLGPLPQNFVNLSEAFVSKTASYVILIALGVALVALALRRHSVDRHRHGQAEIVVLGFRVLTAAILIGLSLWVVGGFLGLPAAIVWVVAVGGALSFIATKSKFGRNAFMIGANREAANLAGINVRRHIFLGFVLMGVLYGVGGVLLDARLAAWSPESGQYLELNAIAAAVIGGTSLMGGVGTIPGAMVGALLLATIDNGMNLNNVNSFLQQVVKGLILLLAVALDQWANRRQRRA